MIASSNEGLTYSTTPGSMNVDSWYALNRLILNLSEIQFSIQPLNPTSSNDVQIRVTLPPSDFELLPQPCQLAFKNYLMDEELVTCETDVDTNTLVLSQVLQKPYIFNSE